MGSIRNSDTMGSLFMDFRFQGQRCREYTALTDTPINRKKLAKVLAKIESEINAGTFVYANYFPNVSVQARHLELKGAAPDHRMHDEHGGDGLQGCDVANGTLALRVRSGLAHRPDHGRVVRAARLRALAIFSRRAATGAATTPRCGYSTAWAAA